MDCKTARKVWNHKAGFIAGIQQHLPGVMEHLEIQVAAYADGNTNPFDVTVKEKAGDGAYYTSHVDIENDPVIIATHDVLGDMAGKSELEKYFSAKYDQPIVLGNICCSGCSIHDGSLTPEHVLRIQIAAVNTEPDGSSYIPEA